MRLRTHFGAGMYGSTSVRCRTISNEAEPEPMTTPACRTSVGTPDRQEDLTHLDAGPQMRRQLDALRVQPAEIDDPTDGCRGRRVRDGLRRTAVGLFEALPRRHGMDEVVDARPPRRPLSPRTRDRSHRRRSPRPRSPTRTRRSATRRGRGRAPGSRRRSGAAPGARRCSPCRRTRRRQADCRPVWARRRVRVRGRWERRRHPSPQATRAARSHGRG